MAQQIQGIFIKQGGLRQRAIKVLHENYSAHFEHKKSTKFFRLHLIC
jgi:hypothetical protein